ncbi:hypothetical protein Enr13x_66470 [Stieleria neptunia]|uniref:Uncharacterized protein n=1 Tax=Stieleria neptunia TaxID=2527979 RepID=A0A518I0Z9_9BACT|nr:hypothetical protein [Stieleria neptunia]QDV46738.1 hypothetical protein Enr13x_66470 [Stieleria neptunia]
MSSFDRCAVDSADEDKPTPEVPTADWDTRFPTAIPIEYIGSERRWLGLSSWPTA